MARVFWRAASTDMQTLRASLQLSRVSGPTSVPLLTDHTAAVFSQQVERNGDRLCVASRYQNARLSWSAAEEQAAQISLGLWKAGYRKGDRLAVWLPNCVEWTLLQIATAKIGVVLVALNPAYRANELRHALSLTECKGIVIVPRLRAMDNVATLAELGSLSTDLVQSEQLPHLRHVFAVESVGHDGHLSPSDATRMHRHKHHPKAVVPFGELLVKDTLVLSSAERQALASLSHQAEDIINIQMSSGTTGLPKAVALSHRNVVNNGFFAGRRMKLSPHDKFILPCPLFHCLGSVLGNLAAITHGAAMLYASPLFHAEATLQMIREERATAINGTPTMFISLLENAERFDCSSLRTGIAAGSVVPAEVMKRLIGEMHLSEVTIGYGMTETSPLSFQSFHNTAFQDKVETVGVVHDHVEVKIVDPVGETVVPVGQAGELRTRGYGVMQGGYVSQPDKTRETVDSEGFVKTGDVAVMDSRGYVKIVGRIKDQIQRGGEKISPSEVENELLKHPGIKDAAIVGVPDARLGEEVCAWIIPRYLESDKEQRILQKSLYDFLKERLAYFKVPKFWIFVDQFPTTVSGKVQKYIMRNESMQRLQQSSPPPTATTAATPGKHSAEH